MLDESASCPRLRAPSRREVGRPRRGPARPLEDHHDLPEGGSARQTTRRDDGLSPSSVAIRMLRLRSFSASARRPAVSAAKTRTPSVSAAADRRRALGTARLRSRRRRARSGFPSRSAMYPRACSVCRAKGCSQRRQTLFVEDPCVVAFTDLERHVAQHVECLTVASGSPRARAAPSCRSASCCVAS